jgi:hypothetical protein
MAVRPTRRIGRSWGRAASAPLAVAALVLAATAVPGSVTRTSGGHRAHVALTPAAAAPPTDRPWLPPPWRVKAAHGSSLRSASSEGDDFCGLEELVGDVPAVRQELAQGDRGVRAYRIATASFGAASGIFKSVYAQCIGRGPVASEEGPALYWRSAAGLPAAALWDDTTVYLVVSARPSAGAGPVDLRPVVADLLATVRKRG